MRKAAVILAAAMAGSGFAAFAVAQENMDDQFMPISEVDQNWYLQRSTCTLAHSLNGNSPKVVRFRIGMGTEIEFVDPALRDVRQGQSRMIMVSVDGEGAEESYSMGVHEDGRQGYRLSLSHEFLERVATGRRLEARAGGRTLLSLDLDFAEAAIGGMRNCTETMANGGADQAYSVENQTYTVENRADALDNAADAARNAISPEG